MKATNPFTYFLRINKKKVVKRKERSKSLLCLLLLKPQWATCWLMIKIGNWGGGEHGEDKKKKDGNKRGQISRFKFTNTHRYKKCSGWSIGGSSLIKDQIKMKCKLADSTSGYVVFGSVFANVTFRTQWVCCLCLKSPASHQITCVCLWGGEILRGVISSLIGCQTSVLFDRVWGNLLIECIRWWVLISLI